MSGDRKRRVCEAYKSMEEDYQVYEEVWELSKDDGFIQRKSSYLILLPLKLYGQNMALLKSKKIPSSEIRFLSSKMNGRHQT